MSCASLGFAIPHRAYGLRTGCVRCMSLFVPSQHVFLHWLQDSFATAVDIVFLVESVLRRISSVFSILFWKKTVSLIFCLRLLRGSQCSVHSSFHPSESSVYVYVRLLERRGAATWGGKGPLPEVTLLVQCVFFGCGVGNRTVYMYVEL